MSKQEVAELVEIMTVGVPEEQRFPLPGPGEDAPSPVESPRNLGAALLKGTVTDADIDRAAGHVLGQMERFGWLDRAPGHTVAAQPIAANARVIQQTIERAAVLLKNDGVLPLRAADLDSLALIGPGALQTFARVTGDEQSFGRAERQVGVWHALKQMAPRANLKLAIADDMTGVPIPASALTELRSDAGATKATGDADIDFTRRAGRCRPAVAAAGPAHSSCRLPATTTSICSFSAPLASSASTES
jgi:beta-glucosidase